MAILVALGLVHLQTLEKQIILLLEIDGKDSDHLVSEPDLITAVVSLIIIDFSANYHGWVVIGILIQHLAELLRWCHLYLSQILEIPSLYSHYWVSLLAQKIDKEGIRSILESCWHCIGDADILFRVDLIAELATIEVLLFLADLLFTLRAASKVHLPLVIIQDALNVAWDLEVLRLAVPWHHLIILVEWVFHLLDKAMSICSALTTYGSSSRERMEPWVSVGSIPSLELHGALVVWLNVNLRAVITRVKTLTAIIWDLGILDGKYLSYLKVKHTC
jgi:hypothetical protein